VSNAVDVRGVLQYVPQFSERTFVVLIDDGAIPEMAVAEILLDILSLQRVGVRLAIGALSGDVDELVSWAIEIELKAAKPVASLDAERVNEILDRGQAAIFNAVGVDPLGYEAAEFSQLLEAAKLILLRDGQPVTLNGAPVPAVLKSDISSLVAQGDLLGIEYLQKAAEVCSLGIPRVHLLDGCHQGVLVEELFSTEGVGTMVYVDSYLETRPLREEDIPELLAMIGRTVRATWLVPRNYEDIREKMQDYIVLTADDTVVGCVALHSYEKENMAELACLYVKQTHEGSGYGKILAEAATTEARQRQVKRIIALSTKAASFFQKQMGWAELEPATLPAIRYQQWEESRRGSLIFGMDL